MAQKWEVASDVIPVQNVDERGRKHTEAVQRRPYTETVSTNHLIFCWFQLFTIINSFLLKILLYFLSNACFYIILFSKTVAYPIAPSPYNYSNLHTAFQWRWEDAARKAELVSKHVDFCRFLLRFNGESARFVVVLFSRFLSIHFPKAPLARIANFKWRRWQMIDS